MIYFKRHFFANISQEICVYRANDIRNLANLSQIMHSYPIFFYQDFANISQKTSLYRANDIRNVANLSHFFALVS